MTTPNLFTFATSELSQDAFICWLLSWADAKYQDKDRSLHECAVNFIAAMFAKHSLPALDKVDSVEVKKQDKFIDVVCVINKKYVILIEDKTNTKEHSGQLEKHLNEIKSRKPSPEKIIPIYYKSEDQSNYSNVLKNDFVPFLRTDILGVLATYTGKNPILIDYREHILNIQKRVDSYKTVPIADWQSRSWAGFYLYLQDALKQGQWSYVPNQSGGFYGFWWHWHSQQSVDDVDCSLNLQLEHKQFKVELDGKRKILVQGKLCIKLTVDKKHRASRTQMRSKWFHLTKGDPNSDTTIKMVKPKRFGLGRSMTVSEHAGDYRVANSDGTINLSETVEVLRAAEKVLTSAF